MSRQERLQMVMNNETDLARRSGNLGSQEYNNAMTELENTMEQMNLQRLGRPRRLNHVSSRDRVARQLDQAPVRQLSSQRIRGCRFTLTRGNRRGEACGNNLSIHSTTHCTRHHNMHLRNEQDVQNLPPSLLRHPVRSAVYQEEYKSQCSELIYDPCPLCNSKVEGAKVTLECGCEYHLNCYLIVQNETHCMKCGDKINKTDEDYEDCSICQDKIKCGGHKTKCDHHFHKDCLNNWKRMAKNTCPNCRANM